MLGTELSEMLASRGMEYIGTDREVDITDPASLSVFAAGKGIDVIVNCAAYTAVDKAEADIELCRAINATGPANVASCARSIGASLLHISTDYVFNGNGTRPYREDDPTDPTGVYGLTKRDGEVAALKANPNTWIVRTAWLYGTHGNNFVFTMLKLMKERDAVKVVNDQRGSPTWAYDLCGAICDILEKKIPYGIYHFSGSGNIVWHDFALAIYAQGRALGLVNRECTVNPCTSAEYPAKVRRPPYSVLDTTKLRTALGRDIPTWETSLDAFLRSI
jgi:dTDP-4-dehydrorhamnose reductase